MPEREILCRAALTPDGWLAPARIGIDAQGRISAVSRPDPAAAIGLGHLVPGMPNLHSHAFQRQMAGLGQTADARAGNFWSWREAMYRLAARVTPEQMQAIAAWLQCEMLEAGYTSCGEFHYLHHQPDGRPYADPAEMAGRLLAAAESSGMALTLLPVLYCRAGFGTDAVEERQRRFCNDPDRYLELLRACRGLLSAGSRHRLGLAPHSLRAVAPDQLRAVLAAREPDTPVHIHVAEQMAEVVACRAALGAAPVEWLLEQHEVGPRWCLVHATHMEAIELSRAAASGAVAGLCPTTEADLGDGFFAAEQWLAAGGRFGIGSDSNLRLDAAEELRLLEFQCRLRAQRRNVLCDPGRSCGRSLYERALAGGAQALAQPVGSIAPGCRADLVELDDRHPLGEGRSGDAVLDGWLFAGGSGSVRTVWVAGERCVEEGRHLRRAALEPPFRRAMRELL